MSPVGRLALIATTVLTMGLIVLPAQPGSAVTSAPFLVGAATASAEPTPAVGDVCIGGYDSLCGRKRITSHDPLTARAVAITGDAGNGKTAILVTTTGIGWFAAYKTEIGQVGIYDARQMIAARIPVAADAVVVQSDHSHAGPDTIGLWGGVTPAYLALLRDAVVNAAVAAYNLREPAVLKVASIDGPPTKSSYSRGPNAGHDDEFRLLVADSPDGRRLLTLSNYSPHATVLGSSNKTETTGDWTAWAAQDAEQRSGGVGMGVIGSIGAMDWNKVSGNNAAKEAEAHQRLATMTLAATAALQPVNGSAVGVKQTYILEEVTQPVLQANAAPDVLTPLGRPGVRIDRSLLPPWRVGNAVGTFAGAVRLGDVFFATAPGEVFPAINDKLRSQIGQGGVTAQDHFFMGAAADFLGYMSDGREAYQQVVTEGALFLAGCPEEAVVPDADSACPDHFILMVSPTIGTHVLCTVQDAARTLGFPTGPRDQACPELTARDGLAAPAEAPGLGSPSPSPSATASPSTTASPSATASPSVSPSSSPSVSPSSSPSGSPSPSPSDSVSPSPSDGPTPSAASSVSASPSGGPGNSPTASTSASAGPSASTTASSSPTATGSACPLNGGSLFVRVNTPTINATGLASVTVSGAQPGSTVILQGYSQNHYGTASFDNDPTPVDRTGVADAQGTATFDDLRPASNTRLRARQSNCTFASSNSANTAVINVRATETLTVSRNRSLTYTFSGTSIPARPGGLIVSLYRVVGTPCGAGLEPARCPGEVFVTQARASAGNTGEGAQPGDAGMYSMTVTFPRSDLNTRAGFVVKTGQDAQNAPGRSNVRDLAIF